MYVVRGTELGINENDSGVQAFGEVAGLANGHYAIVYSEETLDGISVEVRILDNFGQPMLGEGPFAHEIRISDSSDRAPVIAPLSSGGFVVAWTEILHDPDGLIIGSEVRAQTYDEFGQEVGELLTIPGAGDPSLGISNGAPVLVYQMLVDEDGEPDEDLGGDVPVIYARTISNGTTLSTVEVARGTLEADGFTRSHFEIMDVATVGTGYAVVWNSWVVDSEADTLNILSYVRFNTGLGWASPAVGVPFDATGVAATGNGNFIVVGLAHGATMDEQDVVGQLFSGPTGQSMGEPFVINTTTEGMQNAPSVTTLADGVGFVVVWSDQPNDAVGGQAFTALGEPIGNEIVATIDAALSSSNFAEPDVAADPFGGFMITWTGWDESSYGVRGQIYMQADPVHFFGIDGEIVDFGQLTEEQQQLIDDAAASGQIDSVYNANEGGDIVTLPDLAEAQITPNVLWDFSRTFYGWDGDDGIQGGDGNDIIDGEFGNDVLRGAGGDDTLRGGHGNDQLTGGNGNDFLAESQGDTGPFGNDIYDGGAGIDQVSLFTTFGPGVTVDLRSSAAQNTGSMGTDTFIDIEHVTSNYGDDTLIGNDEANWFWTFSGFDRLTGNGGNDYFTVGAGDKVASGGGGIDTIEIADFAFEPVYTAEGITVSLARQGIAQAVGTGTWTLTGFENLGGFTGADELTGDGNANVLAGHIGDDILVGAGGDDQLMGDGTFIMGDNGVQQLLENDTADGPGGADVLDGGAGNDRLVGGGGKDLLIGGTGTDDLDGGEGGDVYVIASASDHASAEIADNGVEGDDEVRFSATGTGQTLVLRAGDTGIETIVIGTGTGATATITGLSAQNVDARALGNGVTITGNSGANALTATDFADVLNGGNGVDRLTGNGGADWLDGGRGADVMYAGAGDDTYVVDDASDAPIERLSEGVDIVLASVAHTLKANVEDLTLTGIYSINGRGNDLANVLTGNQGSNRLWGEAGNDTLIGNDGSDQLDGGLGSDTLVGGDGNDIYFVDSIGDSVTEAVDQGRDTVRSNISWTLGDNVEWLELQGTGSVNGTGNGLANVLRGNSGANQLSGLGGNDKIYAGAGNDTVAGGDGADWLEGGAGRDSFSGGSGSDRYVFREGDFGGNTTSTADRIIDFGDAEGDRVRLDLIDSDTTQAGDQDFAFLGTGAFTSTAGELRYEQISGSTYIQGDTDGDGIADFMIRIDGLQTLASDDFIF